MYKSPEFTSLIDFLAVAADVLKGKKRKRVFSELKTFSAKQTYFAEFFEQVERSLGLSAPEADFVKTALLKIENILSNLKNTPLYTDISQGEGERIFYVQFALPLLRQFCKTASESVASSFFCIFEKLLFEGAAFNDAKRVITLLKPEILKQLSFSDTDSTREFRTVLSRLDERSFLSPASITGHVEALYQNILVIEGRAKAGLVRDQVHTMLFAARCAYTFAKSERLRGATERAVDKEIRSQFLIFNADYTLNSDLILDESYLNNPYFCSCKAYFLNKLGQENPERYLKEKGTKALWAHKNGIFMSYAIREQVRCNINAGRFNGSGINNFISHTIPELRQRQTGSDGTDIATMLIGMKVLVSKHITHNSLEPLVNFFIENQQIQNFAMWPVCTPFKYSELERPNASDFNTALAIRSFNEDVELGILQVEICDPLQPLDETLCLYFRQGSLTKKQKEKRPVKTAKATLYDALKNINYYIQSFGLHSEVELTEQGFTVQWSKCGDGINRYLAMSHSAKKDLLQKISPEEFLMDQQDKVGVR